MADEAPYRTPILTVVFYVFAVLYLIAAAYLDLVTAAVPYSGGSPLLVFEWIPCAGVLFVALLCAGLEQLVDFIGRAAFNSAQAVSAIDEHGAAIRALLSSKAGPPAAPATERFFYQDATGQPAGPVTLDELKRFAAGGTIDPDTLVCQEGREDWLSLAVPAQLGRVAQLDRKAWSEDSEW